MDNYTRNSIILWARVLFITLLLFLLLTSCDKAKKLVDQARMIINPSTDRYVSLYYGFNDVGFSWFMADDTNLSDARRTASDRCRNLNGGNDCQEGGFAKNQCLAAIEGTDSRGTVNFMTGGAGDTAANAQNHGLERCITSGAMNCRVATSRTGNATLCVN